MKQEKQSRSLTSHNDKVEIPKKNPVKFESSLKHYQMRYQEKMTSKKFVLKRNLEMKKIKLLRPRINRNQRQRVLQKHPPLKKMFACISKLRLKNILESLSEQFKVLLRVYMKHYFIVHLHIRQIKKFDKLMNLRGLIFEAIDSPEVLIKNRNFGNNLVKNFCKGFINFIVLFYEDLTHFGLLSL